MVPWKYVRRLKCVGECLFAVACTICTKIQNRSSLSLLLVPSFLFLDKSCGWAVPYRSVEALLDDDADRGFRKDGNSGSSIQRW